MHAGDPDFIFQAPPGIIPEYTELEITSEHRQLYPRKKKTLLKKRTKIEIGITLASTLLPSARKFSDIVLSKGCLLILDSSFIKYLVRGWEVVQ